MKPSPPLNGNRVTSPRSGSLVVPGEKSPSQNPIKTYTAKPISSSPTRADYPKILPTQVSVVKTPKTSSPPLSPSTSSSPSPTPNQTKIPLFRQPRRKSIQIQHDPVSGKSSFLPPLNKTGSLPEPKTSQTTYISSSNIPYSNSSPTATIEPSQKPQSPSKLGLMSSCDLESRKRSGTSPKTITQSKSIEFHTQNNEDPPKENNTRPRSFKVEDSARFQQKVLLQPPSRLLKGKYQIGDELGKGAFGRVFRGLSIQTGEIVAIKQFQKEKIAQDSLESVFRELNLMRKLFHTNIVNFYEYFETTVHLYFIIEYIEGGSLYTARKAFGKFPEELLALYMAQVLRGLQYLHSKEIIHRDIKGANILLNKDGQCKVADFGSCNYETLGKKDGMVGSPYWMAPEIIEGREYSSPASDIWSVGCMILELLNGIPPFGNLMSDVALYRMVEMEHPPFPNNLSSDLMDFLKQCFVRKVQNRPLTVQLLNHPWITKRWGGSAVQESCLAPAPISTTPSKSKKKNKEKEKPKEEQTVESLSKGDQPLFFTQQRLIKKIQDLRQIKDDLMNDLTDLNQVHAQSCEDQKSIINKISQEKKRIDYLSHEKRKIQQYIRSKPSLSTTSSPSLLSPLESELIVEELTIIIQNLCLSSPPEEPSLTASDELTLPKSNGFSRSRSIGSISEFEKSLNPNTQYEWPIPDWMQPGCRCKLNRRGPKVKEGESILDVVIMDRGEKRNEMRAIIVSTGEEGEFPFACFSPYLDIFKPPNPEPSEKKIQSRFKPPNSETSEKKVQSQFSPTRPQRKENEESSSGSRIFRSKIKQSPRLPETIDTVKNPLYKGSS